MYRHLASPQGEIDDVGIFERVDALAAREQVVCGLYVGVDSQPALVAPLEHPHAAHFGRRI